MHFDQPTSLKNLISVHTSPLNLRSTTFSKLKHGPMAKSFCSHAFSYFAPEVWNKLPTIVCHAPSILVFRNISKLTILYIPHSTTVSLAVSSGLDPFLTWTVILNTLWICIALLSQFCRIKASLKFFIYSFIHLGSATLKGILALKVSLKS